MESRLTFTQAQWDLVLSSFVVALFALFAAFVYLICSRDEVAVKYRPATLAGAIVTLVASVAYLFLIFSWITGYTFDQATNAYVPSNGALQFRNGYRYVDWTVTVPLLTAELIGVSMLAGAQAKKARFIGMILAVGMIVTGFLGEDTLGRVSEPGYSPTQFFVWGLISTAFFIPLYFGLLREGFRSGKALGGDAGAHIRNAALVLSFTWGVYPIAYLVPYFSDTADAAVARQIAFTLADITAKVGYGLLIHATAKSRTALDVAGGQAVAPDGVFISGQRAA